MVVTASAKQKNVKFAVLNRVRNGPIGHPGHSALKRAVPRGPGYEQGKGHHFATA